MCELCLPRDYALSMINNCDWKLDIITKKCRKPIKN